MSVPAVAFPDTLYLVPSYSLRASTRFGGLGLVTMLWLAQVQATVHGISHLQATSGLRDHAVPHTALCQKCAAMAQVGVAATSSATAALIASDGHYAVNGHVSPNRRNFRPTLGTPQEIRRRPDASAVADPLQDSSNGLILPRRAHRS